MYIDSATGKTSLVNESTVTYEKAFPDYPTLMSALSVYLAIRALFDADHLGFGYAIGMYIGHPTTCSMVKASPLAFSRGFFCRSFPQASAFNGPSSLVGRGPPIVCNACHKRYYQTGRRQQS